MPIDLTPEQRAEGERLALEGNMIGAVLLVRRATGASLGDSVAIARTWLPEADGADDDGLTSEVIAVGPFSRMIALHLNYGVDSFRETRDGAPVVTKMFAVYRSRTLLAALAAALRFEPSDVNTHALDAARADVEALRDLFDEEVEAFLALRAVGFAFHFHGPFSAVED